MTRRLFGAGVLASSAAVSAEARGAVEHEGFMRHAIEAAKNNPRAPFGAVIVDRERKQILASGFNKSAQNPVWHGEIDAINRCAAEHTGVDWTRLTLYTTAEPCPMCESAIIWAGMPLLVYGTSVPYLKQLGWEQIAIRAQQVAHAASFHRNTVIGGVLERECNALFLASPVSKRRSF